MHGSIYDYFKKNKKATPLIAGIVLLFIMTTPAFKGTDSNPSLIVNEMESGISMFNSTIPMFDENSIEFLPGNPPITFPDTFLMLQATGISVVTCWQMIMIQMVIL